MNYEQTSWRSAPGPGDFHPPEYYEREPTKPDVEIETVSKFVGYRIVDDQLCIVVTDVKVNAETRSVIEYGQKRNIPITHHLREGAEQYARKHQRSGPKLVAWMDKHWGSSNGR